MSSPNIKGQELEGKCVLFVRTSSDSRVVAYRTLYESGVRIVMVHPHVVSWATPYVWKWILTDTQKVEPMIAHVQQEIESLQVRSYPSEALIDGVLSFDEYGVYPAAALATALGKISCPAPVEVIRCTHDKARFRNWCHDTGLCAPWSRSIRTLGELQGILRLLADNEGGLITDADRMSKIETGTKMRAVHCSHLIQFPLIVKPNPGAGGALVQKCEDYAQLKCAAQNVLSILNKSNGGNIPTPPTLPYEENVSDESERVNTEQSPSTPIRCLSNTQSAFNEKERDHWNALGTPLSVLIEEYIEGPEVDIDCVIHHGDLQYALVSDNCAPHSAPYFVESGGLAPSALPSEALEKLICLTRKFVAIHGSQLNTVMHFEAKYDMRRNKAYVVEVNLRLGAAETHALNLAVTGIDLAVQYCRIACGLSPTIHARAKAAYPIKEHVWKLAENTFLRNCSLPVTAHPTVKFISAIHVEHPTTPLLNAGNSETSKSSDNTNTFHFITPALYPHTLSANQYVATLNFPPCSVAAVLRDQWVVPSVLDDPCYVGHQLYWSVGQELHPPPHRSTALGWIAARGCTPQSARDSLEKLASQVHFQFALLEG